jgi:predicted lipase
MGSNSDINRELLELLGKKGESVTTFNQQHQTVNNQYNAGRDINTGSVQSELDVVSNLHNLIGKLQSAARDGAIDQELAVDAEGAIQKAALQAEKADGQKTTILGHLNTAKTLLQAVPAVSGIVTGLVQVAEMVGRLFS